MQKSKIDIATHLYSKFIGVNEIIIQSSNVMSKAITKRFGLSF